MDAVTNESTTEDQAADEGSEATRIDAEVAAGPTAKVNSAAALVSTQSHHAPSMADPHAGSDVGDDDDLFATVPPLAGETRQSALSDFDKGSDANAASHPHDELRLPRATGLSPSFGDATSVSGGGPLPPSATDVTRIPDEELADLPHQILRLKRTLDARPLSGAGEKLSVPPDNTPPERKGRFSSRRVVRRDEKTTEQVHAGTTPAMPTAADKGWHRSSSEPGARAPSEQPASRSEASAASASETPATAESKDWVRSSEAVEPTPEISSPEMVDLDPVREALQGVVLKRDEALLVEVATAAATTGLSGEMVAVPSGDVAPVGVLLVNLGAPDVATARAVRRYLRELLSDRRVIEKDTFTWRLALHSTILPFQPRRMARAYRSIWNREKNESPLKTITRSQAEKLGDALALGGSDAIVDWAMRYGIPSIESRLKALIANGCERIVLVPLYPQYSSTTTATVCDEAFRVLMRLRHQPSLCVAPPYYANPIYIEAIASSIRDELAKLSFEPEVILASYRGMPQHYVQMGDPYYEQCTRTTELLRERLGMHEMKFMMTFQSRLGRSKWLQPYTDGTLRKLATEEGVRSVAVVTPGFAADCLGTLEEVAIENAHAFKKKGGRNFAFIPCLNDSERGVSVIREIVSRELMGWE